MGNTVGSSSGRHRHRRRHRPPLDAVYVATVGAAAHPPPQYPNTILPRYHNYPGYYPPSGPTNPQVLLQHHHRGIGPENLVDGPQQLPFGPVSPAVGHEKAVTIRNDVNIKKETLRMEPDHDNPSEFLLAFTFDATAPGCITVMFFAKETLDGMLIAVKNSLLKQISMPFQQGLCQKFRQPSGTGIDFSLLEETGLRKEGHIEVYPLVLKAEARPLNRYETDGHLSSQITLACFEKKEKGGYNVQVMKQVLWVKGVRYELQEIYGIGSASDAGFDGHESGGECVICLSEPRDITILPCRHMCMCSGCANLLKAHTAKCPICRHPVERFLEIKLNKGSGVQ